MQSPCPLWVKSGHLQCEKACPLRPRKRMLALHKSMSAMPKSSFKMLALRAGRCVVRSRGALPLFQPTASLFRIRSSLVAQWNRNAWKLVQIWLSWGLLLFVFDRHGLRMAARRAFKGSPVMVGLIGWLDARKKHRHSAISQGGDRSLGFSGSLRWDRCMA